MRFGFFASHGGSNLQALLDACAAGIIDGVPCVVISNNSKSMALQRARHSGIDAVHLSAATHADSLEREMLSVLQSHDVDLVILAGYMKHLPPLVIDAYRNRVVNIHPALLPRHGGSGLYGRHVHKAVLAAGDTESGATVHLVDEEYDHGATLAQSRVPVLPDDTLDSLAQRVLDAEHMLYVDTVRRIASGQLILPSAV